MKLTNYSRQAILRAIELDIPKPDRKARSAAIQSLVVKNMSPECRKVYERTPKALLQEIVHICYDGTDWDSRYIVLGDCPKKVLEDALKPYAEQDEAINKTLHNLKAAIDACTTLKQLETQLPEFKKYFPTKETPTKNLPALSNLVADLTKLGWPKK